MRENNFGLVDKHKIMKGILKYKVYQHNSDGEKHLVEDVEERNLIVNLAREQMAHLVAGESDERSVYRIAFGINGTEPAVSDTQIVSPYTKIFEGHDYPETGQVRFYWSLTVSEANGKAIREFGMVTKDGKLFARRVRANSINKESDISLEGTWTIIF